MASSSAEPEGPVRSSDAMSAWRAQSAGDTSRCCIFSGCFASLSVPPPTLSSQSGCDERACAGSGRTQWVRRRMRARVLGVRDERACMRSAHTRRVRRRMRRSCVLGPWANAACVCAQGVRVGDGFACAMSMLVAGVGAADLGAEGFPCARRVRRAWVRRGFCARDGRGGGRGALTGSKGADTLSNRISRWTPIHCILLIQYMLSDLVAQFRDRRSRKWPHDQNRCRPKRPCHFREITSKVDSVYGR
ncbi:hypothetical protein K438DRAFT_127307 [Mycena galopus ATCC 62051]|nr:hypothetical protein K438DRAFT_127307 [Mycena galopus ATCC 62051]